MSIFDNATQVMIGNKEVQSIITSNGGVLYEKQSGDNYLLTLTSDKDILSYYDNDSALLTATLTNNGVGVQGETVRFEGFLLDTPISKTITHNTETQVGSKYIVSNIPITNLNKIFLNKEHTVYITKDAVDGVKIHWPNGGSGDETSNISVENGIITYSRGGTTYTKDCTSYDMSVVYSQVSGFSINDYGVFAVTDSSGVATVSYESKGTGDINIKVNCMNLQETYSIEDCVYYFHNVDKSSDFTPILVEGGSLGTVSYDSTKGVHIYHGSKATAYLLPVTLPPNCVIECNFVSRNSGTYGVVLSSGTGNADGCIIEGNYISKGYRYTNSSWKSTVISSISHGQSMPLTERVTKNDRTITTSVGNVSANSFTMQFTSSTSVYTGVIGNSSLDVYVDMFKIKTL